MSRAGVGLRAIDMRGKRNKPKGFQDRLLALGKSLFLFGGVIAIGLFSAYLGMRLAVRGTEVEVPRIIGTPAREARETLEVLGLSMDVIGERFDPSVTRGAVISQHPQPREGIKAHRKVQVIMSLGERRNPVPDLRSSPLRVARLISSGSGFELGHIGQISIAGVPKDEVIEQFPPPDSEEIFSPRIDVLVSTGNTAQYVMPKVIGERLNRVIALFDRNRVKLGNIQYRSNPDVPRGTVVKQFPEPGYRLTEEHSINLEVSR